MTIGLHSPLQLEQLHIRSWTFHVLVEGDGFSWTAPDGRRVQGFQVWRRVRAVNAAQAEHAARAVVEREWAAGAMASLASRPRLRVGAVSRLGLFSSLVARQTRYEFIAG